MAIVKTLTEAISYINNLYEIDSSPPSSGEEDYEVWKGLLNVAVNLWENEEGVMWRELFVKLDDASTGDKTASAGDYSYDCPDDFVMPASGYVWIGDNTNKTAYKVIRPDEVQLRENNSDKWCYFLQDGSPTLEFNPNCQVVAGTIRYNYYKTATAVSSGTDEFEMSDPMFAVYYVVSELKREEGDTSPAVIATQKMEGMKTRNEAVPFYQENSVINDADIGFGI